MGMTGGSGGAGLFLVTPDILVGEASTWWIRTWNPNGYGPWSDGVTFTAPVPTLPGKPMSPSQGINTSMPTYTWNAVPNSTWYYLWVDDSIGNKIRQWYKAADAGCTSGTGTCSLTPGTALTVGAGKWWVQTWNSVGYGPWSTGMAFTVSVTSGLKE